MTPYQRYLDQSEYTLALVNSSQIEIGVINEKTKTEIYSPLWSTLLGLFFAKVIHAIIKHVRSRRESQEDEGLENANFEGKQSEGSAPVKVQFSKIVIRYHTYDRPHIICRISYYSIRGNITPIISICGKNFHLEKKPPVEIPLFMKTS